MKTNTVYMVHCTFGLCDYNTHYLFKDKDDAVRFWHKLYEEHSRIDYEWVFFKDVDKQVYYYQDGETNVKLYITEHKL